MRSHLRFWPTKPPSARLSAAADLESWISLQDAHGLVMKRRNIGPEVAEQMLRNACLSGRVRSRHMSCFTQGQQKLIGFPTLPLEAWRYFLSTIEVRTNSIHSTELGKIEYIQINEAELKAWLSKPQKGPAKGSIARYAASDRALFGTIKRMMEEENVSLMEAVRELDYKGKVNGRGTAESRIRRVTRIYKKERLGRVY